MNEAVFTSLKKSNEQFEEALIRVNRYFRMLAEYNHALVCSSNELDLLQLMCRIFIDQGKYSMAWAGIDEFDNEYSGNQYTIPAVSSDEFSDRDKKNILRPVAYCNILPETLDKLYTLIPSVYSTIRSGEPYLVSDIQHSTEGGPLRLLADELGFSSYAVFPLFSENKFLGAVNIFSKEPNVFIDEGVRLLKELIKNLAYGISSLRIRSIQKQSELALLESEKKYHTLFEESKDTVFFTSPEGKFLDINNAGVELFGFSSKEELMTVDITQDIYLSLEDREKYNRVMREQGYVKDYELSLKGKDGKKITVLITANSEQDVDGNIVMFRGIMRDVTKRKALEAQLFQSQKMEGIGRLAGGIAHDFNNLLTSILGNAELLKMKLQPGDPNQHYVSQVLKAGHSAKILNQQILAFSRKAIIQPKILNLNSVIDNFKNMLERILGEDIILEFIPEDKLGCIKADPQQIEQIIMNLTVNSRDAMPRGGRLVIETKNVEIDGLYSSRYPQIVPGNYVQMSVTDTGCGIDEKIISHIFEPFFTTKEKGIGTGLGLSTVYGIVRQNDGHINVYSDMGIGSTFKIYFPRVYDTAEGTVEIPRTMEFPRGSGTVLVVEDEEHVLTLTENILRECGYKVIPAHDSQEALSLWNENFEKIDLVLTDVVMPGQNGQELAKVLLSSKPDLKIVFMTGYSEYMISHHGLLNQEILCIQKPFAFGDLARMIHKAMQAHKGASNQALN